MASSQPNVWQTANRSNRNSTPAASRTPQNRSSTASPAQGTPSSQPPKDNNNNKPNVWTQRSPATQTTPSSVGSNGARSEPTTSQEDQHIPANNFNAAEIRAYLSRAAAASPAPYKPAEVPGGARSTPWAKPSNMANGQPFAQHLAKQIATLEGGG